MPDSDQMSVYFKITWTVFAMQKDTWLKVAKIQTSHITRNHTSQILHPHYHQCLLIAAVLLSQCKSSFN